MDGTNRPARRRRWLRRRLPWALAIAAAVALLFLGFGVTSVVTPPRDPADPVVVGLLRDDRHIGLLLPRSRSLVEYGYGDWNWYALGNDSWYEAFATVLWPTTGTLARRELAAGDAAAVRRQLPWVTVDELPVPRARATALLQQLDAAFARGRDRLHHSDRYRMDFVPSDDGYWIAYNCFDAVAEWLRALDCAVSWVPLRLGFEVR